MSESEHSPEMPIDVEPPSSGTTDLEETRPPKQEISRRDFLKQSAAAAASVLFGGTALYEALDALGYVPRLEATHSFFEDNFGLTPKIDIWLKKQHEAHVPKKPEDFLLLGEFTTSELKEVAPSNETSIVVGSFTGDAEYRRGNARAREHAAKLMSMFPVVASLDAEPLNHDTFLKLEDRAGHYVRKVARGILTGIATPGAYATSSKLLDIAERVNDPEPLSFNPKEKVAAAAILAASVTLGVYGFSKEDLSGQVKLDLDNLKGLKLDLAEIYQKYSNFFTKLRDRNMYLNTTALTSINFGPELTHAQLSFAGQHINILRLFGDGKGPENVQKHARSDIRTVTDAHIELVNKYHDIGYANEHARMTTLNALYLSLAAYYSRYTPVTLLVNPQSKKSIDQLRKSTKPTNKPSYKSAHMVIVEELAQIEEIAKRGLSARLEVEVYNDVAYVLRRAAESAIKGHRTDTEEYTKPDGSVFGLAGNPDATDRSIRLWGMKVDFSRGLTARIT